MRTIEKKIIETLDSMKNKVSPEKMEVVKNLTVRDAVAIQGVNVVYGLWNTVLFSYDTVNNCYSFRASSRGNCTDNPISPTTKTRLNALLCHYCNKTIRQKNYRLYLDGKEIETDKWYNL